MPREQEKAVLVCLVVETRLIALPGVLSGGRSRCDDADAPHSGTCVASKVESVMCSHILSSLRPQGSRQAYTSPRAQEVTCCSNSLL